MSASGGDFRPTFATNRLESGQTVAEAINTLLNGMRRNLVAAPEIAIASAYFNPGGFGLLADELEQAGTVRLLNVVNSLDTPVCHTETRHWEELRAGLSAVVAVRLD